MALTLRGTVLFAGLAAGSLIVGCTANGGPQPPDSGHDGNPAAGGAGLCTDPLIGGGVTVAESGTQTCLSCRVENPGNLIDNDVTNFATIDTTLALLQGSEQITVTAPPGIIFGAGSIPGYTLVIPAAALLNAQVLPSITINTYLDNVLANTATYSTLLNADLVGLLANETPFYVGVVATKPFNQVQIVDGVTVADALPTLRVFDACSDATGVGALPPAP